LNAVRSIGSETNEPLKDEKSVPNGDERLIGWNRRRTRRTGSDKIEEISEDDFGFRRGGEVRSFEAEVEDRNETGDGDGRNIERFGDGRRL